MLSTLRGQHDNPLPHAQRWVDPTLASVVLLVGVEKLASSALMRGRTCGSFCSGMSPEDIIFNSYVGPAIARNANCVNAGLSCNWEVISTCVTPLSCSVHIVLVMGHAGKKCFVRYVSVVNMKTAS